MSNAVNFGKTDPYLESIGIHGFSGSLVKQDAIKRAHHLALIQNDYWRVFLYYNPADARHHLPQDSLGLIFRDNEVIFAVADGVSIVGGTHENLSGQVSFDLMKASLLQSDGDQYEVIKNEYANKRLRGASTLQFGKISDSMIEAHFFGSVDDLGLSYYLDDNEKLVSFLSDGYDFFPQSWIAKQDLHKNLIVKGVISTTDGAKFREEDALSLLLFLSNNTSTEEVGRKLLELIPISADDQSVVLIVKRKLPNFTHNETS